MSNQKLLTRGELVDQLRESVEFPPLRIRTLPEATEQDLPETGADALLEIGWGENRHVFAVSASVGFSPKALQETSQQAQDIAQRQEAWPLVLTPYLSEAQLAALEAQQVSGLDLCGNGVIIVPERLFLLRSGQPNRYPTSTPIRKVYQGNSGLVARAFLLRPNYPTTQDVIWEIQSRGGDIAFSTVSKVCQSLADDLIIERQREGRLTRLRLLQPEKLLDNLASNYEPIEVRRRVPGKLSLGADELTSVLQAWSQGADNRVVRTGTSATVSQAVMAREPVTRYYCTRLTSLFSRFEGAWRETERFPEIEFLETRDPTVYFDASNRFDASPIQAFLELNAGDKREQEAAEQLRRQLLDQIQALSQPA